jgi:hypothetical protein
MKSQPWPKEELMSDAINPYKSPETAAAPVIPLVAQGALTETMLIYLKQASPWIRFVAVLGFISAGLTALSGIFFFALIPLTSQSWEHVSSFGSFSVLGASFAGGMVLLFIAGAAVIFFPSLYMYRFGEKIRSYLRTGTEQDLEQAFKNNKSLWKFFGIACIVYMAFLPVMIIGAIIAGVLAAFL